MAIRGKQTNAYPYNNNPMTTTIITTLINLPTKTNRLPVNETYTLYTLPLTMIGYRRATKTLLFPLLFLLILTLLQGRSFVSALDSDEDGDGEEGSSSSSGSSRSENDDTFADPVDLESDPSEPPIPTLAVTPPPAPTLTPEPVPAPLPTIPSGIIKAGTPSPDCAVIADLYQATGPWQFVPDTTNCCNAEYPNSSGIKCNANNQIIYIYLAGTFKRSVLFAS